ncbi:helix-turn-helix domain-containing protein [Streptomyces mirabilis]|uniref:helix-turn-helix domain-containing protein n=1 Tax=Streptomyces mirabilis TaxID=68239 RepID=UPI00363B4211
MKDVAAGTALACARLAQELRRLRMRTGLSMAALAKETAYSKSSWERYLNGRQLAPRQAVESLCAMAGEPPERLVALWELADLEWSGRALKAARPVAEGAVAQPDRDQLGEGSPPADRAGQSLDGAVRTKLRVWAVVAAVCAVGLATGVWLAVLSPTGAKEPAGRASHPAAPAPGCRAQTCTGKSPELMGCGMPGRVQTLGPQRSTSTGARFEIRYSAECSAAWARMWRSHAGDALEVSVSSSWSQRVEVADKYDEESFLFTPMIGGRDLTGLRVCFEPAGHKRREECFRR